MLVLGIDPGFASLGWALVELDKDTERLRALGVIRTKKVAKKLNVLATEDNVRRARILYRELASIFEATEAAGEQIHLIATESQSWPRNASATAKVGIAWGLTVAFAEERALGIVQATPQQIKDAITGEKTATKAGVREALGARPGFESLEDKLAEIRAKTKHEHPVDAASAVIACMEHPTIMMGRAM